MLALRWRALVFGAPKSLKKLWGTLLATKAANKMGRAGHAYVMENYQCRRSWTG